MGRIIEPVPGNLKGLILSDIELKHFSKFEREDGLYDFRMGDEVYTCRPIDDHYVVESTMRVNSEEIN